MVYFPVADVLADDFRREGDLGERAGCNMPLAVDITQRWVSL
jgi:hypothetical protein